jgi:hypothetical protein
MEGMKDLMKKTRAYIKETDGLMKGTITLMEESKDLRSGTKPFIRTEAHATDSRQVFGKRRRAATDGVVVLVTCSIQGGAPLPNPKIMSFPHLGKRGRWGSVGGEEGGYFWG